MSAGGVVLTSASLFGTKPTAAPFYFDDFESHALGTTDDEIGWGDAARGGMGDASPPEVQSDVVYSGSKCLRMIYPTGEDSVFPQSTMAFPAGVTTIRFACHARWEWTTRDVQSSFIFKWARGGYGTPYSGVPRFYQTIRPNSAGDATGGDMGYVTASGTDYYGDGAGNLTRDTWHYIEYEYVLSDPAGTANGLYVIRVNGDETAYVKRDVVTRVEAEAGRTIQWLISLFDGNDSYGTGNEYRLYMDNAYVDTTLARVMLTDNATYSSSTKFIDQSPSSWTDSETAIGSPRYSGSSSKKHRVTGMCSILRGQSGNAVNRSSIGTSNGRNDWRYFDPKTDRRDERDLVLPRARRQYAGRGIHRRRRCRQADDFKPSVRWQRPHVGHL